MQSSNSAGVEAHTKMYTVGKKKGKCRNGEQEYLRAKGKKEQGSC